MARINLSIPSELKEKMDKNKHVNWSAVARKAFEAKLLVLLERDWLIGTTEKSNG